MLFIVSTSVLIRHLWQLETVVFLHWCLICVVHLSPGFYRKPQDEEPRTNPFPLPSPSLRRPRQPPTRPQDDGSDSEVSMFWNAFFIRSLKLLGVTIDIREYIDCSLAQPSYLILIEKLCHQQPLSCGTPIRCKRTAFCTVKYITLNSISVAQRAYKNVKNVEHSVTSQN